MRKFIVVLLSVLCICCAAIGLNGCKKDKHIHAFDKQVITDEYKATDATCTKKAKYYYSCKCGATGIETFAYGDPLGHSFTNYVSDNNATCTEDGTKTAVCDRDGCNEKNTVTDVGSAKGHTYSEKWSQNETEHWHAATCGHNVEKDRAAHTFDENKKCTVCDYITVKSLGLELQSNTFDINLTTKTVYIKVANAVTNYDFSDKFTVADGARFDVCTDKECNNKISSKKTDIVEGDNIFYILVTNGNDVASYAMTVRRRPIYTVTFDTNGGSEVEKQQVEEENYATEPATSKRGYDFDEWDYDFSSPILGDTTISAKFSVKEEMMNYEFTATSVFCEITEVKDTTITCVVIPDCVTSIGYVAFARCKWLRSVEIPDSVTSIGEYAFSGCDRLVEVINKSSLNIEKGSESNGYVAFLAITVKKEGKSEIVNKNGYLFCSYEGTNYLLGCVDKRSTLILPDNYNGGDYEIYYNAFGECDYLTSVVIGKGVASIGMFSFGRCEKLTSITIQNKVSIYPSAFFECNNLENIYITDLAAWCKSGTSELMECGASKKIYLNNELITDLIIPDGVDYIGSFYNCVNITSVTIPDSVTSIGGSAFRGCSGLTSVTIGTGLTDIYLSGAFFDCYNLEKVVWNAENCFIHSYTDTAMFGNCSKLTQVIIGENVKTIPAYTFEGCSGLTSVTIGNSVTSISEGAFSGCSGLTSVTIPNSVTSIGESAFV